MKLMPQKLYEKYKDSNNQNDSTKDTLLWCKFFTPDSSWTWYVSEYNPETKRAFWYVQWFEDEWWSFSLDELEKVTWPLWLHIERDLYFKPTTYSELIKE